MSRDDNSIAEAVEEAAENDQVEELDPESAEWETRESSIEDSGGGIESDVQQVKLQRLEAKLESLTSRLEASQDRNDRMSEKIGSLRESLKDTQRDAQTAKSSAEKAEELVASIEPNEIDKKISRMKADFEQIRDELNEAEERRGQLRNRIRDVKSDLDEIGSLERVKELKEDADEMLKTTQKLSSEAKANADRVQDLYNFLQDKVQAIDELDAEQAKLSDTVENHSERLQSLELESTDTQQRVSNIGNDVDLIKQTFTDPAELETTSVVIHDQLKSELDGITSDVDAKLSDFKQSVPSQEVVDTLRDEVERVGTLEEKQTTAADAVAAAFEEIDEEADANLATTVDVDRAIAELRSDMVSADEITDLREMIEQVSEEQAVLKKTLREIDEQTDDLTDISDRVERLDENVDQIQATVDSNKDQLETVTLNDLPQKVDEETFNSRLAECTDRLNSFEAAVSRMENSPFSKRRIWARQLKNTIQRIYAQLGVAGAAVNEDADTLESEVRKLREQLEASPTVDEYAEYRQQTEQLVKELSELFTDLNEGYPSTMEALPDDATTETADANTPEE